MRNCGKMNTIQRKNGLRYASRFLFFIRDYSPIFSGNSGIGFLLSSFDAHTISSLEKRVIAISIVSYCFIPFSSFYYIQITAWPG